MDRSHNSQSFTVRYFDAGRTAVVEEATQALTAEEARELYSQNGRVLLELRTHTARRTLMRSATAGFDVSNWCRELRTLLTAGMTVVEALDTLQAQSGPGARSEVHAQLIRSLREGQSLSRAMTNAGSFPQVLVASVAASERTSTLPSALEDYLVYDDLLARLRRQVVSAAVYPAVVVSLGLLVTVFLLVYVIPRFSRMYVSFKGAVSAPTQALLWLSDMLHHNLPVLAAGVAGLIAIAWWLWSSGKLLVLAQRLIDLVPQLRRGREDFSRAKLYQSLALMFKGGYPLDEALAVCSTLGLGREEAQGIAFAQSAIARGQNVSSAFASGGLADPVAQRLLAVGERSGNFDAVLNVIANRHAQDFATFVERGTRLVEPLLLLVVALVVGGIVVMMYMPIFDIASGVR